ncbi:aldehyde dehydrogenase family protein, partial [Pseudomonas sp. SIMBA_021]|uniref:aldehyde dehydrogenase family protein n=1 Tax=Pseudomonas sp. SIMBA_021 TaxID=3085767 RepID=UPI00397B50B1
GVGRQILQASAGNMKKVTLELGGKSPNIIFPDADLDKAIEAAAVGFCRNSGQICSAGTRLFVHESLHDEVARRISEIASGYRVGS